MKIAVIDLGTNTCNLLIAEILSGDYNILHQSKQLVRLGDGKIKSNKISAEAIERTLQAFKIHQKIIEHFDVSVVKIIATSAVRSAENKIEFLEKISELTGWLVKVIPGETEAQLIFEGVLLAFGEIHTPSVILDIGGGSNELILTHKKETIWKESRPTGMSRIINRFQISDPIQPAEIELLQNHFLIEHHSAFIKCKAFSVQTLIGCSGAFDTVADIIDQVNPDEKQRITQKISLTEFQNVYNLLVNSTRTERLNIKGMDMVRVDLIVPALILIHQIISEIGIQQIIQTDFALREGVLFEYMNN